MSAFMKRKQDCTYALGDKGQECVEHSWYFARWEVQFDLFGEVEENVYRISPTTIMRKLYRSGGYFVGVRAFIGSFLRPELFLKHSP